MAVDKQYCMSSYTGNQKWQMYFLENFLEKNEGDSFLKKAKFPEL